VVKLEGVDEGVAALAGGSDVHEGLEPLGVSWNGGKEPGIFLGADVHKGGEGALRVAVEVSRAILGVKDIEGFPEPVGISLGRAAENVQIFSLMVGVMAHEFSCRAKGKAFGGEVNIGD
jgi:hypothetical protein